MAQRLNVFRLASAFFGVGIFLMPSLLAQQEYDYDKPPISYSTTKPTDAVQSMEQRLRSGALKWKITGSTQVERDRGVLLQLLEEMKIDPASQVLVFSKSSFQTDRIDPKHPRAIFFNDRAYVGWCPGGLIELMAIDPDLGPTFYSYDPNVDVRSEKPLFDRDDTCLNCHGGIYSNHVPGVVVRSIPTGAHGGTLTQFGSALVDHTTPFDQRWGGWYVTGKHGEARHMGNAFATEQKGLLDQDREAGANITDLAKFCDLSHYLTQSSDIVALMVLEHQTGAQNALTKAHFTAKQRLVYQAALQKDLGEKVTEEPVGSTLRVFESLTEEVLDALLFRDEAVMPDGGIEGSEAFQAAFVAAGPKTKDGRSLRRFQLLSRLFKWRCSHMIYSPSFEHLQPTLRQMIVSRLKEILEKGNVERYAYLSENERKDIAQILSETLPGWPVKSS